MRLLKMMMCAAVLLFFTAAPVFSQMTLGGWGRMVFVPVFIDVDGDVRSVVHAPWSEEGAMEFSISGVSINIGLDFNMVVMRDRVDQIGLAHVWWRPNPFLRMSIGMGRAAQLRGMEATSGSLPYSRGRLTRHTNMTDPFVRIDDGDGIFSRFNLERMGALFEITPMPGLFIGLAFAPDFNNDRGSLFVDTMQGVHAAVGYNLPGIGLFRVGYIGPGQGAAGNIANAGNNPDFSLDQRIEAAFRLNMMPNFAIDVGFKWSLEQNPGTLSVAGFSLQNPLYAAFVVRYTGVRDLTITLAAEGHFLGNADTSAPQIAFNLFPMYNLRANLYVGADISFGMQLGDQAGVNDRQVLGFGGFIHRSYSNGNVRAGVFANAPMNDGQQWGMSVPIWITYFF